MAQVTIVVPVYNMASYLPRCFKSIQAQTCPDWEAILVDDGSPDNSGHICEEWVQKDSRFRVLHKPNGGVCSARNAGLDAARTPYAVLMDQDDLLSPCLVEALLNAQKKYPGAFCLGLHTEEKSELIQPTASPASLRLYKACQAAHLYNQAPFPPPWGKLLDLALMRRHHVRFEENIRDGYEDRPFMRDYLAAFWAQSPEAICAVVQAPLYFWERDNVGSVSQSGHQPLKPWHLSMFDGFLQDCLQIYHTPPLSLQFYMLQYVQTLAFSISCLPKEDRAHQMRWVYESEAFERMLAYFRNNRFYTVFYWPFRWHCTGWVVRLSHGRLENDTFYWRCYRLGRLLCPSWQDWKGIDAIPEA